MNEQEMKRFIRHEMEGNLRDSASVDGSLQEFYYKAEHGAILGSMSYVCTHGPIRPYMDDPRIILGEQCYVGARSIILLGVKIGRFAIAGAGSVITKDIPAYEVWAGNPARYIRHLTGYEVLRCYIDKKFRIANQTGFPYGVIRPRWEIMTLEDANFALGIPRNVTNSKDPLYPLACHMGKKQGKSAFDDISYDGLELKDVIDTYIKGVPKEKALHFDIMEKRLKEDPKWKDKL